MVCLWAEKLRQMRKDMSRILSPFRKRVLQSAVNFPVIVTQQYLTQFLKMEIWNLIPEPSVYFSMFF